MIVVCKRVISVALCLAVLTCSMTIAGPEPVQAVEPVTATLVGAAAIAAIVSAGAAYNAAHPNATLGEVAFDLGTSVKSVLVANAMMQAYAIQHGSSYTAAGRGWGDAAALYSTVPAKGTAAVAVWNDAIAGMTTAGAMSYAAVSSLWGLVGTPPVAAVAGPPITYPSGGPSAPPVGATAAEWAAILALSTFSDQVGAASTSWSTTGWTFFKITAGGETIYWAVFDYDTQPAWYVGTTSVATLKAWLDARVAGWATATYAAGSAAIAAANIGWESGIAAPGTVAIPATAVNEVDLTDAVTAPYPNGGTPLDPPPIWAIPLIGTAVGLLAIALQARGVADSLAASLEGLGEIGFGIDKLLEWLLAPITAFLNGLAALLEWIAGVPAMLEALFHRYLYPDGEQLQLEFQPKFNDFKQALWGVWPFALIPLVAALLTNGLGTGIPGGLDASWDVPIGPNVVVHISLSQLLGPIQPYRWLLVAGVWFYLAIALVQMFKPRVQI